MRSKCSDFLHPHNDVPTSRNTGVFACVPRKRRVVGTHGSAAAALPFLSDAGRDEWLQHRGKRVSPATQQHDAGVLQQIPAMERPATFKGSLRSTRFGEGFARKTATAIGSDVERIVTQERTQRDTDERLALQRQTHADRSRYLSPISWEETTTSKFYTCDREDRPTTLYPTNVEERNRCKRVFPDRHPTTVGPPATPNTVRRELDEKRVALQHEEQNLTRRQQRVRSEGRVKPNEWTVGQQMSCMDGYVLKEMLPVGEPVRRKMLVPRGSTRPW